MELFKFLGALLEFFEIRISKGIKVKLRIDDVLAYFSGTYFFIASLLIL